MLSNNVGNRTRPDIPEENGGVGIIFGENGPVRDGRWNGARKIVQVELEINEIGKGGEGGGKSSSNLVVPDVEGGQGGRVREEGIVDGTSDLVVGEGNIADCRGEGRDGGREAVSCKVEGLEGRRDGFR